MELSNTQKEIPFSSCRQGHPCTVAFYNDARIASKLLTMGLLPGDPLTLIRKSLLGSTFYVQSDRSFFALRKEEAATIMVLKSAPLEKSA